MFFVSGTALKVIMNEINIEKYKEVYIVQYADVKKVLDFDQTKNMKFKFVINFFCLCVSCDHVAVKLTNNVSLLQPRKKN